MENTPESFTVEIVALSSEGTGIGQIIAPTGEFVGKKVSVPGSIPGEILETQVYSEELPESLPRAQLISIKPPHTARRATPCEYLPACGGCTLQHMSIDKQRAEKFQMVQSLMLRQAKLTPQSGYTLLGQDLPEFSYRNRILLHLDTAGELGFYRSGSGEVVDIERCLLAEDGINDLVARIRPFSKNLAARVAAIKIERRKSCLCILLKPRVRDAELDSEIATLELLGVPVLHDQLNESDAGHFSQVNAEANEILVSYVLGQFADKDFKLSITELYAGAGNFTFPLAQNGRKIRAVELDENLTAAGTLQAAEAGLSKSVTFISQSCEKFCRFSKFTELVLLDPPRAGARIVAETLTPKDTQFIVYVSCNPATLARDLKILTAKGYVLDHIAVLDMFSQTAHVEMMATLRARS